MSADWYGESFPRILFITHAFVLCYVLLLEVAYHEAAAGMRVWVGMQMKRTCTRTYNMAYTHTFYQQFDIALWMIVTAWNNLNTCVLWNMCLCVLSVFQLAPHRTPYLRQIDSARRYSLGSGTTSTRKLRIWDAQWKQTPRDVENILR